MREAMKPEKNENTDLVLLKSLLEDKTFREIKAELPVVVGRNLAAQMRAIDLALASNVLIAGATGQGKTTELHSMIISLLRSRTPDEVKFVFIDPKDYELSAYRSLCREYVAELPGMEGGTVLVSAEEIEPALGSLCREMRRRLAAFRPEGRQPFGSIMPRRLPGQGCLISSSQSTSTRTSRRRRGHAVQHGRESGTSSRGLCQRGGC